MHTQQTGIVYLHFAFEKTEPQGVLKVCLRPYNWASQVALAVKNPPANAGDIRDSDSIPGSGRFPGGEHGNVLQYSCLENPMDRGAWRAIDHRVTKSWT